MSDKRLKHKNTQGYIITYSERQKAETQKQVVNLIEQNHTFLINFNWILFQPFVAHYILRVSLFMTRKRTPPNPYLLQGCYAHLAATCHYCKRTGIIFSIILSRIIIIWIMTNIQFKLFIIMAARPNHYNGCAAEPLRIQELLLSGSWQTTIQTTMSEWLQNECAFVTCP